MDSFSDKFMLNKNSPSHIDSSKMLEVIVIDFGVGYGNWRRNPILINK